MVSTFWSNTIWYILLGISTIVEIILVLNKAKNRRYVTALFLIISGITFCIEVNIFCFLKSYDYYPMIIPQSPIDDTLAGNLFSQFSVTATALLISVFELKYYWFFIFSTIYGIIEELFLKLGIYSQNWYHTWLTVFGMPIIFWFTRNMYKYNLMNKGSLWKYIFMLFGVYTLHMPTILWIQILSGIVVPNTKIFTDAMRSYAFVCLLNLLLMSIACTYVYFSKLKWQWKYAITVSLYAVLYFGNKLNLFYVKEGWFLIFATIDILGMYLCIFILDKLMKSNV